MRPIVPRASYSEEMSLSEESQFFVGQRGVELKE